MRARRAVPDDIGAIAALTRANRACLAGWSPVWWRQRPGADDLHAAWLGHLVSAEGPVARVVEEGGEVVACAVAVPQPGQWFVDDVSVADPAAWPALLAAVEERPALTCAAAEDRDRAAACRDAGLTWMSSLWIGPAGPAGPPEGTVEPLGGSESLPAPPPHTFAGLAPALVLGDGAGGVVAGSPSLPAPPIYDPGGTVAVVDRLTGADRARLLAHARAAIAARGDVLVAVVAAAGDAGLADVLGGAGLTRTVDVYAWP
ncbi:MAG TPA: hypothetical protein VH479_22540 [Acidimicrobiales bacterium]|jgi:hypothetical protein